MAFINQVDKALTSTLKDTYDELSISKPEEESHSTSFVIGNIEGETREVFDAIEKLLKEIEIRPNVKVEVSVLYEEISRGRRSYKLEHGSRSCHLSLVYDQIQKKLQILSIFAAERRPIGT